MAYYMYMTDVAEILGADKDSAAKELKESLEFEIKLASVSILCSLILYLLLLIENITL